METRKTQKDVYELGEIDGYEAACEYSSCSDPDHPESDILTAVIEADNWDGNLINALRGDETAKYLIDHDPIHDPNRQSRRQKGETTVRIPTDKSVTKRFWPKVRKGPSCWTWQARRNGLGYGEMGVGSRTDGSRARP